MAPPTTGSTSLNVSQRPDLLRGLHRRESPQWTYSLSVVVEAAAVAALAVVEPVAMPKLRAMR
jgi:hypothetical protein